jgi:GNAT superfamily N-acetyltransferase
LDATSRVATAADLPAAVETITSSFFHDPVWSWIFPDDSTRADIYRRWWPAFVRGALQYDWLRVTPDCEAVALWLPPGGAEFTPDDQATFDALIEECAGARADLVREAFVQFEVHGPKDREYHYLSVFGTHADHRGQGLGMALLAENLADLDAAGSPAYLE